MDDQGTGLEVDVVQPGLGIHESQLKIGCKWWNEGKVPDQVVHFVDIKLRVAF